MKLKRKYPNDNERDVALSDLTYISLKWHYDPLLVFPPSMPVAVYFEANEALEPGQTSRRNVAG